MRWAMAKNIGYKNRDAQGTSPCVRYKKIVNNTPTHIPLAIPLIIASLYTFRIYVASPLARQDVSILAS
jgi:hypothetical protein